MRPGDPAQGTGRPTARKVGHSALRGVRHTGGAVGRWKGRDLLGTIREGDRLRGKTCHCDMPVLWELSRWQLSEAQITSQRVGGFV